MHVDITVVGAGMAGSALAIALAQNGFRVAIAEAASVQTAIVPFASSVESMDLRVVALSQQAMALLEQIAVWQSIPEQAKSYYQDMQVWDAEGTARVEFSASDVDHSYLGCLIENRVLVSALQQGLAQNGVALYAGEAVTHIDFSSDQKIVTLASGETIRSDVLIGADGGNSYVRELLGVEVHTADNHQKALVCNVAMQKPHDSVARQRFLSTGPLAFLPMAAASPHVCSIVWSCDNPLAEELMALDDGSFAKRLTQAFEGELGVVERISSRAQFPLVVKHAQTYAKHGVYLVADAAHVIHPLAGQGINLGFQDVEALVGSMLTAKRRRVAIAHPRVAAGYQRVRKAENLRMIAATQGFKHVFGRKELGVRWARNQGMRFVNGNTAIRQAIISGAMGLNS